MGLDTKKLRINGIEYDLASAGSNVDIIDNLETADSSSALSANQGKVLNEKINELQEQSSDLESVKEHANSSHAPSDAEKNTIISIQKNGTDLEVDADRKVNIIVPTTAADINAAEASHDHDNKYDSLGAAENALTDAKAYVDSIVATKSDATHNHDDKYEATGAAESALTSAKTYSDTNLATAKSYTDSKISDLLDGADDATLDSIKELADAIKTNDSAIDALNTVASNKADKEHTHEATEATTIRHSLDSTPALDGGTSTATVESELSRFATSIKNLNDKAAINLSVSTDGSTITYQQGMEGKFITLPKYSDATTAKSGLMSAADKTKVDSLATVATSGNYSDLSGAPTIPTKTSQLTNDSGFKTTDNNTTYTLTKSGSTITLTGSDGSTTSVTDSDSDTHYTTGLVVGNSATATTNTAADQGQVYLNVLDNSTVRNSHRILGAGNTTVTSDANGTITINSASYNHPTTSGNKHIPAGGASGQILKWSENGTATWANENSYTHPNSGVTAGTYRSVTVNAQGHVTAGSNPTVTVAQGGTGATDAATARTNLGITPANIGAVSSTNVCVPVNPTAAQISSMSVGAIYLTTT